MLEDKRFKNTWIWLIIVIITLIIVYFIWHFLFSTAGEVSEQLP